MVGFKPDGTIHNISVLDHAETPGLGSKIEKSSSSWSEQFNGKNPTDFQLQVRKDGGDVDAITAATISSRAYCDAVQKAYKAFQKGGHK
jgi:electron transport complex protein RnfG